MTTEPIRWEESRAWLLILSGDVGDRDVYAFARRAQADASNARDLARALKAVTTVEAAALDSLHEEGTALLACLAGGFTWPARLRVVGAPPHVIEHLDRAGVSMLVRFADQIELRPTRHRRGAARTTRPSAH